VAQDGRPEAPAATGTRQWRRSRFSSQSPNDGVSGKAGRRRLPRPAGLQHDLKQGNVHALTHRFMQRSETTCKRVLCPAMCNAILGRADHDEGKRHSVRFVLAAVGGLRRKAAEA